MARIRDTAGRSITIHLYNQLQEVKRLVKERHDRGQACVELYLPVVSVVNTLLRQFRTCHFKSRRLAQLLKCFSSLLSGHRG